MTKLRGFVKFFLLLIGSCYSGLLFSQSIVSGVVEDAKSHTILPYCSISIKGTQRCTMTNGDGAFSLYVSPKDTLLFSYVGYETMILPVEKLAQTNLVFLNRTQILLQEVVIHGNDAFIFDLLSKCRKTILKDHAKQISRVYYGIETQTSNQPIELVECYYNGIVFGPTISELNFKNGRIGLAPLDNRYFISLNTSRAIAMISLTGEKEHTPIIPLQLNERKMRKLFIVTLDYTDDLMYKIDFRPVKGLKGAFSGSIWIDKYNTSILKIDLVTKNTDRYPFSPLGPNDSLYNVDLNISHTFRRVGNSTVPDHINFSYHVTYKSVRDSLPGNPLFNYTRDIFTDGILCFYDYGSPFLLPYFEYDNTLTDYQKMSIIPYNATFWNSNNALLLTEKQKEDLGFLAENGYLINYREGNYGKNFLKMMRKTSNLDSAMSEGYSKFFENNYTFWSPDERIILNKQLQENNELMKRTLYVTVPSDQYNLKVQILLDANDFGDSVSCKSYTVFDIAKSYYVLPEDTNTRAFLNIFFDICEIERQKMEKKLHSSHYTASQVDSLYKNTIEGMDGITQQYLKEVSIGHNTEALRTWNSYVKTNLQIDNLQIFAK